jgi:hypothetical protein
MGALYTPTPQELAEARAVMALATAEELAEFELMLADLRPVYGPGDYTLWITDFVRIKRRIEGRLH